MRMNTTKRLRKTTFKMKNLKDSKTMRKMNMIKNAKKRLMNVIQKLLNSLILFKEAINRFITALMMKKKMMKKAQGNLLKLKIWIVFKHLTVQMGNN